MSLPASPPTYAEATAGDKERGVGNLPPPTMPMHPSWAYVHPTPSECRYTALILMDTCVAD